MEGIHLPEEFSLPANLKFGFSEESGRGIYATQTIPKGSEIFIAQPLSHVVHCGRGRCHGCLLPKDGLLRCSGCKKVHYCCRVCQRKDWFLHKRECMGFCRVAPNTPTDTMRLVLRLLLSRKASGSVQKQVDSLMSNVDKFSAEVKSEMLHHIVGVTVLLGPKDEEPEFTSDEIFCMLGKVVSNTFNIMDCHHEEEVGMAVYGLPSLLNHSCEPNTITVFKGATLCVRSIRDLAPGDQLTISYYEVLESHERRRAHLNHVYCFTCACSRCQHEDRQKSRSSKEGEDAKMPLQVSHNVVNTLSVPLPDDFSYLSSSATALQEQGYQLLDKTLKDMEALGNWDGIIQSCTEFIVQATGELQSCDIVVARVTEQLMRAQLEIKAWHEALETGTNLCNTYRHVLPQYHPVFVLHLVKLSKLRRCIGPDSDYQQALRDLAEAEKLAVVTFGSESALRCVVKELMDGIRMELCALQS